MGNRGRIPSRGNNNVPVFLEAFMIFVVVSPALFLAPPREYDPRGGPEGNHPFSEGIETKAPDIRG